MSFTSLPARESAVDACERVVRDAILGGALPPGSRLPPERALAEQLGVNRMTLRAALTRLESADLLHVRQGSGYTVRDWWGAGPELLGAVTARAGTPAELRPFAEDLLALRRSLAVVVLERLAASAPDPAPVAEAVERFAAAVDAGASVAELAPLDIAISRALVRATGRPALALTLNPVLDLLSGMPALCAAMYREPSSNVAGWRALLAWLAHPHPAGVPAFSAVLAERDAATLASL